MSTSYPTILITGAGSGIGRTMAIELAQQGYHIVLNDLDAIRADAVAYQISASGGKALAIIGDAGSLPIIEEMKSAALQRFGRIDAAIANAGLTAYGDFFEVEESRFQEVVDLNLKGSFFLAQSMARYFREQKQAGRLLFLSSNVGILPLPQLASYSMTKAALRMLAKSLAIELAPYRITVNCLAPGATLTPRTQADDPAYQQHWEAIIPDKQLTQAEDIAQAAIFLLSKAARHITGQTLTIDGGWSLQGQFPDDGRS